MTTGDIAEQPIENTARCPECNATAYLMMDKEHGYYKACTECGYVKFLNRRFLRFDRQSRQWS